MNSPRPRRSSRVGANIRSKNNQMRISIVGAVALLVLTSWVACAPDHAHQLKDPPEAKFLARVLILEYERNPIRFERDYVGSQWRTYGEVQSIESDGSITFDETDLDSRRALLECHFADKFQLDHVITKSAITVTGTVESVERVKKFNHTLHLTDCELVGP